MSDGLPNDWTDEDQEDLDRSEPESGTTGWRIERHAWLIDSRYFTETTTSDGRRRMRLPKQLSPSSFALWEANPTSSS